ncbi:Prolactin regulatory element-binding protein [Daphnia magna]|uniref:Prolactin regulatory element-binding protein n=1 Tax=Daphnia magna TaxID=35525 RepID=A0A164JYA1_9CRUS|nr:Prolactin regulatory element-binding protein [Daphnia magna]
MVRWTAFLWTASPFTLLKDIKAHENEVDDIDFSPDCQKRFKRWMRVCLEYQRWQQALST